MSDLAWLDEQHLDEKIKNTNVVILEPDYDTRNLFSLKLKMTGFHKVIAFSDPDEVIDYINSGPRTSLFVIDVFNSDDVWFSSVQNAIRRSGFPVVLITAIRGIQELTRILASEAWDVIVKPFEMDIFILKIEKVLTSYFYNMNLTATYERNERLSLNILQVMARVIEVRFPFVQFHSENVARYARLMATMAGLSTDRIRLIGIAGVLHDLGKIGVREEILNKPGSLTEEEYEIVKMHPIVASEVLTPISEMNIVLLDVRHHHEWFDGTGYPDGIKGEDIPVGARILHIAEAYDTMIGERVYKPAYPKENAISELIEKSNTQFDADIAKLFIDYLQK